MIDSFPGNWNLTQFEFPDFISSFGMVPLNLMLRSYLAQLLGFPCISVGLAYICALGAYWDSDCRLAHMQRMPSVVRQLNKFCL